MSRRVKNKKEKNREFTFKVFTIYFLILLILDQLSKYIFLEKSFFLNSLIYINYSKNFGSAFSMFSNIWFYNFIVIILSFIALISLSYNFKYFFKSKLLFFSFIFAIAGIVGNLVDRIFLGYVQDFIGLKYLFIFNLADIYLNLALILFLFYEFKQK